MVGLAVAGAVSLAWCVLAVRLGPLVGLVDHPDDPTLKAHDRPAVPLGGVGVFLGVHLALAMVGQFDPGLLAATSLVLLLGLADDRWGLPPLVRLAVQIIAGVALVLWADTPLQGTAPLDLAVGVVLVVVTINAVNLFDGLDGLVGASGAVAALGAALLAAQRGVDAPFGAILAAALAGFLVLNWHRARVFLGDNGAYTVGLFLVYGIVIASPDGAGPGLGIALLVLGVFGTDLVATVIRRRVAGHPMFTGDRSHLYDQLRDRGMSIRNIAFTSAAAQVGFVAAALGLDALDLGAWSWLALAGIALALLAGLAAGGFLRAGQAD